MNAKQKMMIKPVYEPEEENFSRMMPAAVIEINNTIPEIDNRIPKYFPLIGLGTILPIQALQGGS
jgi:hypothetical protein|tara:strand:+ start:4443 stop:4637 length:195 start_codon:yes stop_codon:yes gene_type:complete